MFSKKYYYGMSEIGLIFKGVLYPRKEIARLYNEEGMTSEQISFKLDIPIHIVEDYIEYARSTSFNEGRA